MIRRRRSTGALQRARLVRVAVVTFFVGGMPSGLVIVLAALNAGAS